MTTAEAHENIGNKVIYLPTNEEGVITSVNEMYVFVRYGSDTHSKATRAYDLVKV